MTANGRIKGPQAFVVLKNELLSETDRLKSDSRGLPWEETSQI